MINDRKKYPLATGLLDYFPDALMEVAYASAVGNEQHNPGQPIHWAKEKSTDEADALLRHLRDRGKVDTDGVRHSAKVAWRALALLQREIEATHKTPAAQSSPAEDAARNRLRCGARTRENAPSEDSSKTPPPWLDRSQLESWQELSRLYLKQTDTEGPEPLDPEGTLGL